MIPDRLIVAATLLLLTSQGFTEPSARIAIIIDDLGYKLEEGRRAIQLPGPVAYAILPGTPRGKALAETAHDNGKEVLLHLPLQAVGYRGSPEASSITLDMSRERLRSVFAAAIDSVPFAIGVNGHRGSLLTRHPGHMRWLMEEIRDRDDLFFVDSYTTPASVALQVAEETGIASMKRDVFLDHDITAEAIAFQFKRLKSLARQHGVAVAIGHPHSATLELLERELPKLLDEGIELVAISELLTPNSKAEARELLSADASEHRSELR